MRKPAQEPPQVLTRSGSPLLFGLPTFCHLLARFLLSLCLHRAPHTASAAETNFWFLRTTNPEAAGVSQVQEIASQMSGKYLYAASPSTGTTIFKQGEMGGRGRWGARVDGKSSLGKDGELWRGTSTWEPIRVAIQPDILMQAQSICTRAPHCHRAFLALPPKNCLGHPPFSHICVHPLALHVPFHILEAVSLNSHLGDPNSGALSV